MSEEPKSIWKRKWKGPRGLFAWFIILAIAAFVIVYCFELLNPRISQRPFTVALLFSIVAAAAVVLSFALAGWLFSHRNRRRTLFGVVCLITFIALFYAEENWRGHHAWQKYKRALEAKGETVDLAKLAPPPVPDDQNFAMAPIILESIRANVERFRQVYAEENENTASPRFTNRLEMPIELPNYTLNASTATGDWRKTESIDLKVWQSYFRKLAAETNYFPVSNSAQSPEEDVLLALSRYNPDLHDLRIASERIYSRFPVKYENENPAAIELPHLGIIKGCLPPLGLRAVAELQAGDSAKALEDVKLMFRLTDSIRTEPILISQLVRIAMIQLTIQPIWEGLAEHNWTDAQLAKIESDLSKLDFIADYRFAIRGERAFGVGCTDFLNAHRQEFDQIAMPNSDQENSFENLAGSALNRLIPAGWFEQNKLSICRMHTDYFLAVVNAESNWISMPAQKRASQAVHDSLGNLTPYNWFARFLIPALEKVLQKFAHAQATVDLARVACALERFRLAHGKYPETLDALAPEFLKTIPHDIIGGQPLKYRRTEDGQFILYSIGWNETDDGGTVAFSKGKTPSVDIRNGDWVWKYPAE